MPRTTTARRCRRAAGRLLATAALLGTACATAGLPPPLHVLQRAHGAESYSASLRVSLKGRDLRGRARVLIAFERPGRLRLELPAGGGLRLVAVVLDGTLTAVFPGDRAFYESPATAEALESILGVALAPAEVMDLLLGIASPRLRAYRARWGPALPRKVEATLPDGARLDVRVDDAEIAVALPPAAFRPPPHEGYRELEAAEARRLWQ